MREISRLIARLIIVFVSGAARISWCAEPSVTEPAAETEAASLETSEESAPEPR